MNNINIAIDGPSGAGKSTLAKAFAKKHGFIYVDTGALYRSIGLYAQRKGVSLEGIEATVELLPEIKLELRFENNAQSVILNGENVNDYIRTPEISMYASAVSAIPAVRSFLLDLQRSIAAENNVIMDGRDIGTVILPNAQIKIFLSASAEARAQRRFEELVNKGIATTFEEVLKDMEIRDRNDSTRKTAPAIPAEDAIFIDNSKESVEETVVKIESIAKEKLGYAI